MCKGATGTKLQRWPLIERSLGLLRTNLQSMSDQHNEKITQIYKYVQGATGTFSSIMMTRNNECHLFGVSELVFLLVQQVLYKCCKTLHITEFLKLLIFWMRILFGAAHRQRWAI